MGITIKYLRERYGAKRVVYYAGLEQGNERKRKFYEKVKSFGFEMRIKPVVEFKGKFYWKTFHCPWCKQRVSRRFQGPLVKKANCDVDLSLDGVRYCSEYETLLLFSGDGDFCSLVDFLKMRGKKTIVVSSKETCSRKLRRRAWGFIEINCARENKGFRRREKVGQQKIGTGAGPAEVGV